MTTAPSVADPLPRRARTSAGRAGSEGSVFDVTVDWCAFGPVEGHVVWSGGGA
ncbi:MULTISPECIES: hypothetical protein [Streptomyces]|uniref:Uncharacterized protein n=1 Tax=Streptomyces lienomycini TaxID=284035 RepID=A0ABV9X1P4_9ACTN|nr:MULTISPECIES: hypothetical protein [Streptomyces]